MKNEAHLWIRWKGVARGPYTREDIEKMLAAGDIGLFHEVYEADGEPQPLRVWRAYWNGTAVDTPPAREQRTRAQRGYLWSGLCFLLPPLFALAFINAQGICNPEKRRAQLLLAGALTTLGTFIWILLDAAW